MITKCFWCDRPVPDATQQICLCENCQGWYNERSRDLPPDDANARYREPYQLRLTEAERKQRKNEATRRRYHEKKEKSRV